jgi:hypothetical protein
MSYPALISGVRALMSGFQEERPPKTDEERGSATGTTRKKSSLRVGPAPGRRCPAGGKARQLVVPPPQQQKEGLRRVCTPCPGLGLAAGPAAR